MSFLGIICGVRLEAKCLADSDYSSRIRVAVSAADPDRAEFEATRLAERGAKGLLSFGLCGALAPALNPGDLVAPRQIISNETFTGGKAWTISPFPVGRSVCLEDIGWGSDAVIAGIDEKRTLHETTKSAIVDMESHRVGKVCEAANLPFFVLRAVCDPAHQAIPKAVEHAIDAKGNTRALAVMAGLMKHPGEFGDVLQLKKQTEAALRTLRTAADEELPHILRRVELV